LPSPKFLSFLSNPFPYLHPTITTTRSAGGSVKTRTCFI
jgi:hypothetical protein